MSTIPASQIVSVVPSVISAGGSALDLVGVFLTTNTRPPVASLVAFSSAAAVATYFGSGTPEALAAAVYFNGFDGSTIKPGSMLFAQYPTASVASYLRGGSIAALTLAQLQALSGTLILTVNGVVKTSSTINLSAATSFSNAATIILAAFTTPGFTLTYDSVSGGFIFLNSTTGASSTLTYATGTLSTSLLLTSATGATLSQGAIAAVPGTFMDALVLVSTNWASFTTMFDPDSGVNTNKLLFAAWVNAQQNRYCYVCWDTDVTPTASNAATGSLGYILKQLNSSGTFPIYAPDYTKAAFVCGAFASIDFDRVNGRSTLAYKSQTGLALDVTNGTVSTNLTANGYNYYGSWSTANQLFQGLAPGSVTGPFTWADSYINEIWLNNAFQLALMTLLFNVKSIPYNLAGYALVKAACMDPINQGLNFGAFRAGVPLSALQIAEVNTAAGVVIDQTLSSQGWYLQIQPASAQVRAARGSPPCAFWYMDGGSIHKVNLASIMVQ